MSYKSAQSAVLPLALQYVSENDTFTIDHRGEPLLEKALQVASDYDEATKCPAVVVDRTGKAVKTPKFQHQLRFCNLCRRYFNNLSPGLVRTGIWEGSKYPCGEVHTDALAESRRFGETHIYSCKAGFAYWTSPLYRNGHYAGALTSGQVLLCTREEAVGKFRENCRDSIAAEKFNTMLENVAEKTHEEINSMARLLGVCADELSKKAENRDKTIRRRAWHEGEAKGPHKTQAKNTPKGKEIGTENSLEKERMLLAAFQRGDNTAGKRILKELMDQASSTCHENLEILRIRAIELLVLLSRASVSSDKTRKVPIEDNQRNMTRLQESKTLEELIENLQLAATGMAGRLFSYQGLQHASALLKAQRYIWENYTKKISLKEISRASGLSAPYFSSIFNEEMGENLSNYLNRLRIEKAAAMLTETGKPLNEIATLCGFEDQSWFSKVFKNITGVSPGKYR